MGAYQLDFLQSLAVLVHCALHVRAGVVSRADGKSDDDEFVRERVRRADRGAVRPLVVGVGDSVGVEVRVSGRVGEGPSARDGGVSGVVDVLELSDHQSDVGEFGGKGGKDESALFVGADDGEVVGQRENVAVWSGFLRLLEDGLGGETEVLHAEGVALGAAGLSGSVVSLGATKVDEGHGFLVEVEEEVERLATFVHLQIGQGSAAGGAVDRVASVLAIYR